MFCSHCPVIQMLYFDPHCQKVGSGPQDPRIISFHSAPQYTSTVSASSTGYSIWSATVSIGFQSTRGCSLSCVYWLTKLHTASRPSSTLPRRHVPASVLRWCQTETKIRSSRGPRHPQDCHEVWSSFIRRRCPVWVEPIAATRSF